MIRFLAGLWLAVLLAATPALAQNFPERGRAPVVDQAQLLNPQQEAELTGKLEALNNRTGRQFVVATVNDLGGQEIADYSYQLGRYWKIGDEKRDDGIVMVVAPNERKVWIATGYGAEGFLPDILVGRIVRGAILPRFKAGDMPGGIAAGADAVIAQAQLPPDQAQRQVEQAKAEASKGELSINPMPVIFIVIIFFLIIGSIARAAGGRRYMGKRRRGLDSGDVAVILWGLDALTRGGRGRGGWGGGGSWGGGGGGGFGGFTGGGGSFGGGGAGGSW